MWLTISLLFYSAQRNPIIMGNRSNSCSRKTLDYRATDRTRCYFQHVQAPSQPSRNGRVKGKEDLQAQLRAYLGYTSLVCARRHQQIMMRCAYSSAELQCSVPRAHGQALHEASRVFVDVKPRFEREIRLVRLQLNRNSQYFAIFNQLAKQRHRHN